MLSRGPLQLLYTSTIFGKLSLAGSLWCTCCCSRLQLIYSKGEASRIFNQTSPLCYSTILSGELTNKSARIYQVHATNRGSS